jgi:hypothetical protein
VFSNFWMTTLAQAMFSNFWTTFQVLDKSWATLLQTTTQAEQKKQPWKVSDTLVYKPTDRVQKICHSMYDIYHWSPRRSSLGRVSQPRFQNRLQSDHLQKIGNSRSIIIDCNSQFGSHKSAHRTITYAYWWVTEIEIAELFNLPVTSISNTFLG